MMNYSKSPYWREYDKWSNYSFSMLQRHIIKFFQKKKKETFIKKDVKLLQDATYFKNWTVILINILIAVAVLMLEQSSLEISIEMYTIRTKFILSSTDSVYWCALWSINKLTLNHILGLSYSLETSLFKLNLSKI